MEESRGKEKKEWGREGDAAVGKIYVEREAEEDKCTDVQT